MAYGGDCFRSDGGRVAVVGGGGQEEGFYSAKEGSFAGVVEAQEEDGIFFFAGKVEVEGFGEVVHCSGSVRCLERKRRRLAQSFLYIKCERKRNRFGDEQACVAAVKGNNPFACGHIVMMVVMKLLRP